MFNHEKKFDIDSSKTKPEIYTGEVEPQEKLGNNKINPPQQNLEVNFDKVKKEAFIDKLKNEEDKEICFELKYLERKELNVNLIYFDKNMKGQNYEYFNIFKTNVVGGFFGIDDIDFFKSYLEVINDKKIPFIIVSSGRGVDEYGIIEICKKYPFIKEVIIFCGTLSAHENKTKQYPDYVKKVFNNFKKVHNYIKSLGANINGKEIKEYINSDPFFFSNEDIQMDNNLSNVLLFRLMNMINVIF